jgi:AcrR family transcriptional regulator
MPKIIDEEEVFAAVVDLLAKKGYENATTKAIAAAAGIHEATLFRKYKSKICLVMHAIEQQLAVVPIAAVEYTGNLEDDLRAIIEAFIETNENQRHGPILSVLLTEAPRYPELAQTLKTPLGHLEKTLDILHQYQMRGQLKQEPPVYALMALLGGLMSYYMFIWAVPDYPVPPIDPQILVSGFLQGRKA